MGDPAPRRIRKGSRALSDDVNRNDGRYHFVTDTAGGKSNLLNTANTGSYHWFEALKVVQQEHVRDGSFPLHMAVAAGAPREVIEMLVRGSNLTKPPSSSVSISNVLLLTNKYGETPLHIALMDNQSSIVATRALDGAFIDTDDKYDLVDILLHGDRPCSSSLSGIDAGPPSTSSGLSLAVTRIKDKRHGNLPLHNAVQYGCSVSVAKMLLQHHPNAIHEKNHDMKTPLQIALEYNHCSDDVLRLLEISDHAEDIPSAE